MESEAGMEPAMELVKRTVEAIMAVHHDGSSGAFS